METQICCIGDSQEENQAVYRQAAGIIRAGGLVAFPTETVYGLGANALDEAAAAKIYAAKGRPSDNPLIVHIARQEDLYALASEVSEGALRLAEKFWPGPLTMILKKAASVPLSVTGGLQTVAVRMPSHPAAARLIRESQTYIAAPSANLSGKPSPTRAEHVIKDLKGRIDMILVDDTVDIGIESTIVDMSAETPMILRPGFITKEQLECVLGTVQTDPALEKDLEEKAVPKAPGMKYKHYAPAADMALVEGTQEDVICTINALAKEEMRVGKRVGVMASTETAAAYHADVVLALGSKKDAAQAAKNLYAVLRTFDKEAVDKIYAEVFEKENVGAAVMNRLIKAAGHTIIRSGEKK